MDSVSAVIAPLLGGKQNEGDISFCESVAPEAAEFTAGPAHSECVSGRKAVAPQSAGSVSSLVLGVPRTQWATAAGRIPVNANLRKGNIKRLNHDLVTKYACVDVRHLAAAVVC